MPNELPYMPLWINDWLTSRDVICMTAEQRGIYIQLLCHQWISPDCSLPDDDQVLAALAGVDAATLSQAKGRLQPCFDQVDGKLRNERLYSEWLQVKERHEAFVKAGRKGGKRKAVNKLQSGKPPYSQATGRLEPGSTISEPEPYIKNPPSPQGGESEKTGEKSLSKSDWMADTKCSWITTEWVASSVEEFGTEAFADMLRMWVQTVREESDKRISPSRLWRMLRMDLKPMGYERALAAVQYSMTHGYLSIVENDRDHTVASKDEDKSWYNKPMVAGV